MAAKTELCVYQLKVTLAGTKPLIWRRMLVASDLTLEQLHVVLQAALGWFDEHLYEFRIAGKDYGPESKRSDAAVLLSSVFRRAGAQAVYTYDFGDSWQHAIVVEKISPVEPGRVYPVCIGGKRAGPPEDCGGVPGFQSLLRALRNPKHKLHQETRKWVGDDYDPEKFSPDEVNRVLAPAQEVYR